MYVKSGQNLFFIVVIALFIFKYLLFLKIISNLINIYISYDNFGSLKIESN